MTKVVALQTWSNGTITMDEKSVQDIPDALASTLIAQGICADASSYFGGGGSGGGVLVVHETVSGSTYTLDKTFKEIKDAGFSVVYTEDDGVYYVYSMTCIDYSNYSVDYASQKYTATSEDGYPFYEQGH